MRPRLAAALLLAMASVGGGPAVWALDDGGLGGKPANDPDAPLPVRVNQAIDSGVAWLKKQTFAPGNFCPEVLGNVLYDPNAKGDVYVHPTGCTSLALYTLLKCDVPKDDPVIRRAFNWLRTASGGITKGKAMVTQYRVPNGTYELAALILALEAKSNPHKREAERERELKFRLKKGEKLRTGVKLDPEDEPWMMELVAALVKRWNRGAGWRYGQWTGQSWHNGPRGTSDMSATQLAMLALLSAERCGIVQPDQFYVDMLKWVIAKQQQDGEEVDRWDPSAKADDQRYGTTKDKARGWGYLGVGPAGKGDRDDENVPTGSMTCCGLANLLICTHILEAREAPLYTVDLQAKAEKAWWDGVAWLDYHWTVDHNTNHGSYHYYYLYCMERVGDLKRIQLLAGHPWYNEGAQVLVDQQSETGAWTKQDTHRPHDVLNTCFALLFLNRSTPAITGDD